MITERELVDQKIRNFMEGLWERGDPWDLENSAYERDRCAAAAQNDRRQALPSGA